MVTLVPTLAAAVCVTSFLDIHFLLSRVNVTSLPVDQSRQERYDTDALLDFRKGRKPRAFYPPNTARWLYRRQHK